MKAKTLFKKLGYTQIVNKNEEIYYKETNYGDEERIVFDIPNKVVYKKVFMFPRIDLVNISEQEKVAVDLRVKELNW